MIDFWRERMVRWYLKTLDNAWSEEKKPNHPLLSIESDKGKGFEGCEGCERYNFVRL